MAPGERRAGTGPIPTVLGTPRTLGELPVDGRSEASGTPRQRGLRIPSFFIRASSVVGLMSSCSAAPCRPLTRQPVVADLTDERAVKEMISHAQQAFGRLDALVNCASIWTKKAMDEVTTADLRSNFDANLLSTFLCCQQAGLVMVEQPTGGAIVNLGDWATRRPYLDYSAYFASKGSIPTITRDFAVELAARNPRIRVNAILPGPVMLPAKLSELERNAAIDATLLKREGNPDNIADAAVFLIENDFITGVCLPVDGGRSIHTSA